MAFSLAEFARVRPYAFHLTSAANLPRIRRERRLYPTLQLAALAGRTHLAREHRPVSVCIEIDGEVVHLRDQAPLRASNVVLSDTWTFGDVVEMLNNRVFFWPGSDTRPIPSGQRHFERYANESIAILRVPTDLLFNSNPLPVPEFCKWNSGAPRWTRGIRPVRGADTFLTADQSPYRASAVVELTFPGPVLLPDPTHLTYAVNGTWEAL
jgi:hypothetical protein